MNQPSLRVIRMEGELEISRRDEIAHALQVGGDERGILLDFSGVTYADSTSLAEMLRFAAEAQHRQIPVAVVIESRQFARIIQYAGLSAAFTVFEERSQALTFLASPRGA